VKLEVTRPDRSPDPTQDDIKPDDQSHVENVRPIHPTSGGSMEEPEPEYGITDVALAEAATKKKAQPIVRTRRRSAATIPAPRSGKNTALPRQTD